MKVNLKLWLPHETIEQLEMMAKVTGKTEAELIELMIDEQIPKKYNGGKI